MALVKIDRSGCISCEVCWSQCPEVFQQNPEDLLSEIVPTHRIGGNNASGEIPEELREGAQSAADQCPVAVIHVE